MSLLRDRRQQPRADFLPAEVVVYFGDDKLRLYQLRQWLPVFERLDDVHPVLIVTRRRETFAELPRLTSLRSALASSLADLVELYEDTDPKVAIYVNNSMLNFQSLADHRMLHIHVNHGESDKICMASNQVKAYDRVLVVGDEAVVRYRTALLEFDERRLVRIGRPQLDLRPAPVLPPTARRTIVYAPTWEGENPGNDYTSLDRYGPAIMIAALALPGVRVVYKPHPRVLHSIDPNVASAHRAIVKLVDAANHRDVGAGHHVAADADILAVFLDCDLLVTDVSSVGLDFLYLHVDKPLFIADRYDDRERLLTNAPISRCADIVDANTVDGLAHTLAARLARDEHRAARETARRRYFGDLKPGQSTERFLAAVDAAINDAVAARGRPVAELQPAAG